MRVKLSTCPYCTSQYIHNIWPEAFFWQCKECHLFFRNPMPTDDELSNLYKASWMLPENHTGETGRTNLRLARIYARRLLSSLGLRNFEGLRILDFGAGRGAMLHALQELGATVCGVEPFGYDYLIKRGFHVYRDVSEVADNSHDGIVMIDVFEHLPAPWATLKRLRNLLSDEGWIYIATGNPLGLNARITRGRWREAQKSGHLLFPTPSLMERTLREAGFSRVRRLRWLVRFSRNPALVCLHYLLQMFGLDGEIKYLGWK